MKRLLVSCRLAVGVAVVSTGCALNAQPEASFPPDSTARAAVGAPGEFNQAVLNTGGTCQSPITDPTTGAKLRLVRSQPGRGDYELQPGQYNSRPQEYLRLDCNTRKPIGLVPR